MADPDTSRDPSESDPSGSPEGAPRTTNGRESETGGDPHAGRDASGRDASGRDDSGPADSDPETEGGDGDSRLAPAPEGPLDLESALDPANMIALDRRVVAYWLLSGLVGFLVLTALVTTAYLAFGSNLPGSPTVWRIVVGSVLFVLLAWNLVSPMLAWQRWRYKVRDDMMLARYGIVFHEEKAIPISRLQHVELGRGPLERFFGLATLVVFTAGSENAAFRLPGLLVDTAQDLRDRILEARGDDVL